MPATDSASRIKIAEFVSFCIENYKVEHGIGGTATADLFDRTGALNFLFANYDVLHTLGREQLLQEIDAYLHVRNIG